jgi:hypothetical protein
MASHIFKKKKVIEMSVMQYNEIQCNVKNEADSSREEK